MFLKSKLVVGSLIAAALLPACMTMEDAPPLPEQEVVSEPENASKLAALCNAISPYNVTRADEELYADMSSCEADIDAYETRCKDGDEYNTGGDSPAAYCTALCQTLHASCKGKLINTQASLGGCEEVEEEECNDEGEVPGDLDEVLGCEAKNTCDFKGECKCYI